MWDWVEALGRARAAAEPCVLVTVTGCKGSVPRESGAKMLVSDASFSGTIGGGRLEELAIDEARRLLHEERDTAEVQRFPLGARAGQCCGGSVELLFEPLNQGPVLQLYGAGHVAQAIVRVMSGTPFRVVVADERAEWREALGADVRAYEHWEDLVAESRWSARSSYAVVLTHRHDLDEEILRVLLEKPARYLGLIGSRAKWTRFRQRLEARGLAPELFRRVHCPIGIPIGGKSPAEVAISLAAELLQIHHGDSQLKRVTAPRSELAL